MKTKKTLSLLLIIFIFYSCSENKVPEQEHIDNSSSTEKAYIYNGNKSKIVELNLTNGNEIDVSTQFTVYDNHFIPIYYKPTNEIIGIDTNYNRTTNQNEPRLVKINLNNGNVSFTNLTSNNRYGALVNVNGNVYVYSNTKNKLVKLDIATGGETDFSNNFTPFDGYFTPKFNPETNEIIGRDNNYNSNTNQNEPRLIKINISNGDVSYLDLKGEKYSDIVIGNKKPYILNSQINKIVEVNLTNGNEVEISNLVNVFDGHFIPNFIKSTNEIVGIDDENNKLIKINIENRMVSYINLSNSNFGEIIIK